MTFDGIKTLEDMNLKNKIVFLRTDYNVPLDKNGKITDDSRIKASLPTIKKIFSKGAKQIIIASHLGKPEKKEKKYQMDEIAKKLFMLSRRTIKKMNDCVYLSKETLPSPKKASIILLENVRFHEEEELNAPDFAKQLAKYSDIYVNDAFGECHREYASVHAITKYLPGCIGLNVEKELKIFKEIMDNPETPYIAILGGAKLQTKLPVIRNLLDKVDKLLLGGGMIFTFYKAKGYSIGKSIFDKDQVLMAKMLNNNEKIILPEDVIIADDKDNPTQVLDFSPKNIPSYMIGLDLGEKSIKKFKQELSEAKMVVWNGPLGYYENKTFLKSTVAILKFLASKPEIKTIIGGGDTVSIVEKLHLREKFFHVSTGGGASLVLLEGKPLPAIEALRKNN